MKKNVISIVLALSMCLGITGPTSAAYITSEHDSSATYYVDEETRKQDIQRQIDEVLDELNKQEIALYGRDPDAFDYYTEIVTVETKKVSKGGFAGNQNPGGVCFGSEGGAFFWSATPAGATGSASVSFSVPFKIVTVSFDFGGTVSSGSSNIGYIANVGKEYQNDYVKLYITQTKEVQQVNYYKTNKKTGERVALLVTAYPSTLFSEKYDIKVV